VGVGISIPHLVRTVRRFVDEEERVGVKGSTAERHPEPAAAEATKPKAPVTYQVSEQPSSRVQEEEFAKQLRLARYLAAGGSPPSRQLEPVRQPRTAKKERSIAKAGAKNKGGNDQQESSGGRIGERKAARDEPCRELVQTRGRTNRPLEVAQGENFDATNCTNS
jgi:hypothetical protein